MLTKANATCTERLTTATRRLRSPDGASLSRPIGYARYKAALEFLAAVIILVFATPIMVVAALAVKLTSRGPIFYSQTRLGRDGRPYSIYKFRSMQHDCEKLSGACWSTAGDPRITRVGHFLRRTHIDELPQLWNVLCGDMSLVGPRPERPEFIPRLEEVLPHYRSRLLVRPGVTGLAQVQLPPDTDILSVRRKLAYDLYYVQHCNPWLDIKLVLATALHVLGVSYDLVGKLVSLPSDAVIELSYQSLQTNDASRTQVEVPSVPEDAAMEAEMASCR